MSLVLTKPDDSPLDSIELTAERGVESAHVQLKIFNSGDQTVSGAYLVLYAETAAGSGVYRSEGQPVVDERMGRLEVTGQDSSGTPGQQVTLGQVQPMGHLADAILPDILPGDAVFGDFWLAQAGSSAGGGAINIKLELANERTARPLPIGVAMVGNGIDTGLRRSRSFAIDGLEITASGPPDADVHVAAGHWLIKGEVYEDADGEDITLSQTDGGFDLLTVGESYIAVITAGPGGFTVTKGIKDTAPERPSPPADELILAWVTVLQNTTSVIQGSDIDQTDLIYGRYRPVAPATGLSVEIHGGEAVIDDFSPIRQQKGSVTLAANSTNRVWLERTGVITVTQSDVPPSAGAVKICQAVTNATDITSFTDTRRYIGVLSGTPGSLTVHTGTDSPTIASVTDLTVPEGSLVDLGGGAAEIVFPADSNLIHKDGSVAFTANQSMGSHKLTNVTDPTSAQDAATKAYVDSLVGGGSILPIKQQVRAATTVAGTLATSFENGDVIDGVTLATGDRILIKDQATASQNGIYTVNASGAPTRATDADASAEVKAGMIVFVEEGTVNADSGWILTTNNPITLGTTGLAFAKFTGAGGSSSTGAETKTLTGGTTNDLALANTGVLVNVLKLTASSNQDLTGIVAPAFGQIVPFVSIAGANRIRIKHANTGSSANNRIQTPDSADFDMTASGEGGIMFYDVESLVWRVIAVNFGAGGGGSISVTDGSTTVDPCTDIEFTTGATVTDAGGGLAQIAIAGGGGGEIGWEVGSMQTMMTTELNSLGSGTAADQNTGTNAAFDNANGANLFLYGDWVLEVTFGSAPTANSPINLYILEAADGTNYETGDSTHLPPNASKGSFIVFAVTTLQRLKIPGVVLPPAKFKVILENGTNQAFAASGNTLKFLPYKEQLS